MVSITNAADIFSNIDSPIKPTAHIVGKAVNKKPKTFKDVNPIFPDKVIPNGSEYFEMDTGAAFLFDEEEKEWLPI